MTHQAILCKFFGLAICLIVFDIVRAQGQTLVFGGDLEEYDKIVNTPPRADGYWVVEHVDVGCSVVIGPKKEVQLLVTSEPDGQCCLVGAIQNGELVSELLHPRPPIFLEEKQQIRTYCPAEKKITVIRMPRK
jgi:hypothetical protein